MIESKTVKEILADKIETMLRLGQRRYTLQGAELDWVIAALRAHGEAEG